uniref:Mitogen-activated protein kinase-binding protein 1-like n=1 Tax=Phallusia mammillata TaxID=59560 RepID=A0A6F9DJN5_9ASCI|nr:mitogen-activated protein kinase-binding protein 1-like [Phallusia mammillata]
MERSNSTAKDGVSRRKRNFANFNYRRRSRVNCAVQYNAELGSVLGLTLKSNCAFACDSNSALLAYPAGCVIVLHNPRNGKQQFIFNPGQKTITCLKFSCDGNFIATGESGHQPCVRVFSVSDRSQVASVQSHKYGVSCVDFSPNSKYVISIGYQHDNVINVWDWKRNIIAASNKVSTKVKSVAFSECSNYFVTVGNRHVKFWYLEKASTPDNCTVPLKGRSAILETLRNHMFCDVVCGVGADSHLTFAITRSGLLCQFNAKRTVARHVELKGTAGRTICIINDTILCGSGNGYIYIYSTKTLDYMTEIAPPDIVQ